MSFAPEQKEVYDDLNTKIRTDKYLKGFETKAHEMAHYNPSMLLSKFEILKVVNEGGDTNAHELARKSKYYLEATKDLTKEQKAELFALTNKDGITVSKIFEKCA